MLFSAVSGSATRVSASKSTQTWVSASNMVGLRFSTKPSPKKIINYSSFNKQNNKLTIHTCINEHKMERRFQIDPNRVSFPSFMVVGRLFSS